MPPRLLLQPGEPEVPEAEMPEEIQAPARTRVAGDTQQTAACLTSRSSPPDGREITNYPLIINQFPVILS